MKTLKGPADQLLGFVPQHSLYIGGDAENPELVIVREHDIVSQRKMHAVFFCTLTQGFLNLLLLGCHVIQFSDGLTGFGQGLYEIFSLQILVIHSLCPHAYIQINSYEGHMFFFIYSSYYWLEQ